MEEQRCPRYFYQQVINPSQTCSKAGQSMSRKKKCSFTLWAPFAPRRLSGSWKPQFTINSKSLFCLCQKPAHSLSRFSGQLLKPEDRLLGGKIFWKPFQAGMWLLSLLYLCRADLSSFLGNGKVHSQPACCRAKFQEPTWGQVPFQGKVVGSTNQQVPIDL